MLQTANGNVEAKVVCFYRRRDISSTLIALADKHASESRWWAACPLGLAALWSCCHSPCPLPAPPAGPGCLAQAGFVKSGSWCVLVRGRGVRMASTWGAFLILILRYFLGVAMGAGNTSLVCVTEGSPPVAPAVH